MLRAKKSKKANTVYPMAQHNNPEDWNLHIYKLLGSKKLGNFTSQITNN
jgi:hypothetical protein